MPLQSPSPAPAGLRYPNVREALYNLIPSLAAVAGVGPVLPYKRMNAGFEGELRQVPAVQALVHIRPIGPVVEDGFRMDRVALDWYALDLSTAEDTAQAVLAELDGRPHDVPAFDEVGSPASPDEVLDVVEVELAAVEVPYPSDELVKVTATVRVFTRGR